MCFLFVCFFCYLLHYVLNFMESNAFIYFCVTFCHLSWACLFIFNNKSIFFLVHLKVMDYFISYLKK